MLVPQPPAPPVDAFSTKQLRKLNDVTWRLFKYVQLDFLLEVGAGLDTAAARHPYSLHSFRIYLACALYAAGCPNDRIMAILRWRSEEALAIYARMNDAERTGWVLKSLDQRPAGEIVPNGFRKTL